MKFDIFDHVAISAGAGSGKTYTLSRRYINILVGFNLFSETEPAVPQTPMPALPEEIVTITYTEAGALEMRSRIYALVQKVLQYLHGELDGEDGDFPSIHEAFTKLETLRPELKTYVESALNDALATLGEATISTIHAYCLELIDHYGDFLGLDARPEVAVDEEKQRLFDRVYRHTLEASAELVKEIDRTVSLYHIGQIASRYCFDAGFRRAFDGFAADAAAQNATLHEIWRAKLLLPEREVLIEGIRGAERMGRSDERKADYAKALVANTRTLVTGKGEFVPYPGQLRNNKRIPDEAFAAAKKLRDTIAELWKALQIDEEGERRYVTVLAQIHTLLETVREAYGETLAQEGYTDFETILEMADRLLEKPVPLRSRYIMVDEFQDTNDFQWGIVRKAAAKTGANLFIVGDEKQSIFSFQGADVATFARAREDLEVATLSMGTNRRSEKVIIDFVNTVFSRVMAPRTPPPAQPLALPDEDGAKPVADALDRLLEVWRLEDGFEARYEPLDTPAGRDGGGVELLVTPVDHADDACEEACSEPEQEMRHIAGFVREAVRDAEGYKAVAEAYEQGKKAVAILLDTRNHMLLLKRTLKEAGLAAKVADSGNFYETKEVNDLFIVMKLLTMMEWLDVEKLSGRSRYVIVGALRSNLLRLDADAIDAVLRGGEWPEILERWRRRSEWMTPAEVVAMLVDESRLLHVYRLLDDFAQREANVAQLMEMAESYSLLKGASLREFVRELEECIHNEAIGEEEAFVVEEGVGSIEIRTMHSSKGLEWPLVVVASTSRSFMGRQPSESLVFDRYEKGEVVGFKVGDYVPLAYRFAKERNKAKHIAERKRLLYVALTRAEHYLAISLTVNDYGNKKPKLCGRCGENNYFTLINQALGLDIDALYKQEISRTERMDIPIRYPQPWRPAPLEEAVETLTFPSPSPVAFASRRIVRPSGEAETGAFWEAWEFDAAAAGTVVHKILETGWRSLDDEALFEKWFDAYNVPEQWRERIERMARSFQRCPHYRRLKEGAEHYFEFAFMHETEAGLVRGSIDLLYYDTERDGWVVVDFKTTTAPAQEREALAEASGYYDQLGFYRAFVESLGKGPVVETDICWLEA